MKTLAGKIALVTGASRGIVGERLDILVANAPGFCHLRLQKILTLKQLPLRVLWTAV